MRHFLLDVARLHLVTVATFVALHQFLLAWTLGPLMALVFALPASFLATWALRLAVPIRANNAVVGGLMAACGGLSWAVVLAFRFGSQPGPRLSLLADVVAGVAAGLIVGILSHKVTAGFVAAAATFVTFGLASPFLGSGPVQWAEVRALAIFVVAAIAGAASLDWRAPGAQNVAAVPE